MTAQAALQASVPTLASTLGKETALMSVTCTAGVTEAAVVLVLGAAASSRTSISRLTEPASQAFSQSDFASPAVAAACLHGVRFSASLYVG